MKQTPHLALLTLTLGLLSACSTTTRHAPVIDRNTSAATPVRQSGASADESRQDARGGYTVRRGDTLLRIALDHGQNYRDLVTWNNLTDPDDIKVGQVLRVTPERAVAMQTAPVAMPQAEARSTAPRKSAPRGDKRPFSESVLADLQKGEGNADKPDRADVVKASTAPAIAHGSTVTATDDEKLSWMWPSDGRIVATFDEGKNKGIDIAGKAGQQVMAAGSGKVMYAGSGIRGYGNLVIVKHSNSLLSAYAHNRSIVVKEGQTVNKGQVIAEMGDSDSDSVKLHFEIRQQGKPVDPSKFLPNR
jgi:lipoprotein NlpD